MIFWTKIPLLPPNRHRNPAVRWRLEALPRHEAASRKIFTALVLVLELDFSVLVLASVLRFAVLARHQVAISARHTEEVCKK